MSVKRGIPVCTAEYVLLRRNIRTGLLPDSGVQVAKIYTVITLTEMAYMLQGMCRRSLPSLCISFHQQHLQVSLSFLPMQE